MYRTLQSDFNGIIEIYVNGYYIGWLLFTRLVVVYNCYFIS